MEDLFGQDYRDYAVATMEFDPNLTSSTLNSANGTHRVCAQTREVVIETEKKLSDLKGKIGEMKSLERNFREKNNTLTIELENARQQEMTYKMESERLKDQILRLVELDEVKNRDIEKLEGKMQRFYEQLEYVVERPREEMNESNGKSQQLLDLHRKTVKAVQQECLQLLFSVKDVEEAEREGRHMVKERRELLTEVKNIEVYAQNYLVELRRLELSEDTLDLDLAIASSQSLPTLYAFLRRLFHLCTELSAEITKTAAHTVHMRHEVGIRAEPERQAQASQEQRSKTSDLDKDRCRGGTRSGLRSDVARKSDQLLQLQGEVDQKFNRAKRVLHRLKHVYTNKADEFAERLNEMSTAISQYQERTDDRVTLAALYQQLTNLYHQNLDIAKQIQAKGNENMTDLRVRLERGVKDQADFTSYIASITKGGERSQDVIDACSSERCAKRPSIKSINEDSREQKSLAEGVGKLKVDQDLAPTSGKYQKLWIKYRKQNAQLRALQHKFDETESRQRPDDKAHRDIVDIHQRRPFLERPCFSKPTHTNRNLEMENANHMLSREADSYRTLSSKTATELWCEVDGSLDI